MVGSPYNDAGGSRSGSVFIFFGGPAMDNNPDVNLTGTAAYNGFGDAISSAGDVNNDGYDDVIVGVPYNYSDARGCANIFFGGSPMDNVLCNT
jgi:hypothetical protein